MPESDDEHADASGNRLGNNPSDFTKRKNRNDKKSGPPQRKGKYVNLKLVDFGSRVSSSATGGKAAIRGDACLSLLLFESEVAERVTGEDGKPEIFYRGGSKGAFEEMAKLKEGSVVALLNPKVLKPFQVSSYIILHIIR
jgi:minichromosome maintenance protein 10